MNAVKIACVWGACLALAPRLQAAPQNAPAGKPAAPAGSPSSTAEPNPAQGEPHTTDGSAGALAPQPGDMVRLETADGHAEWTLFGTTLRAFQDFLRAQSAPVRSGPAFSISFITLAGSADDDVATLTAQIDIQVDQDGVSIPVPIELSEAYPREQARHEGPGECRLIASANAAAKHVLYLRGKGLHRVTVPLVARVTRQLNQRHLLLTLPTAVGSQLTLRVSKEHCTFKPIDAVVRRSDLPHGTQIEAFGIKGPVDISWEIPVEEPQGRTVFDVVSKCTLGMEGDRIQLHVAQTIDSKQGNLASLRVRMPKGFNTITGQQLYVPDAKEYTAADIDAAGFIRVALKPVTAGRVELRWDLEGQPQANAPVVLRGFDVEGARTETGDIAVMPSEGFHFEYRSGNNLRRINVATLGQGQGVGLAESAYAYLQQPFRLDLSLEEIRPRFTVDPTLFLLLSEQRAELTAQFRIQVSQGALRELNFAWPDWKKQGWTIDAIEQPADDAEIAEAPEKDANAGHILRVRLHSRHTTEFVFAFRATRPIPRQGQSFPLSLPALTGSQRQAVALVVADAENIKSSLEPRPETSWRPLSRERREAVSLPESFRGLQVSAWRVESAALAFNATAVAQKQEIRTNSIVGIEVQENRLRVVQRITYHVAYERLAEAAIVLPKELRRPEVQFYVDGTAPEFETRPSWTTAEADTGDLARVAFTEPRIGSINIFAVFTVPLSERFPREGAIDAAVPLLRSRDAAFKRIRIELKSRDDTEVEVLDDAWTPQIAQASGVTHAWMVRGDRGAIPLRLLLTPAAVPGVRISKALIESDVASSGGVRTTAQYRIENAASSAVLTLPASSSPPRFWLDDVPLKADRFRESQPGSGEYRIDLGSLSSTERILKVEYADGETSPCGFVALHRLGAPVFPPNTSIRSLLWRVSLPYDQFLSYSPTGFSPEFRWRRDELFWTRQATGPAADVAGWLGAGVPASGGETDVQGNAYTFSRFGEASSIVVGSMAQSFVIVIGAGLALLAAFVLMRLPAMQTPLSLFLLAFVLAVTCLWFGEAVRLLLQPALLGFALALVAALVDARIQKRRVPFLLAAPSAAEFVVSTLGSSAVERGPASPADPEAPTINRASGEPVHQPLASLESGTIP